MRRLFLTFSTFILVCLSVRAPVCAQDGMKTLKVKVAYTGEGKVDGTAGIHLYLFDTPNISEGAMPIGLNSAYKNGEVVTFQGLTAPTVYLVAGYGEYSLMGPPPSGTPVSWYKPGEVAGPSPIELGEAPVEIEFTFDDSNRMP